MESAKILPECREKDGKHLGFYTEFATTDNEQVLMKAGISFTSVEGAPATSKATSRVGTSTLSALPPQDGGTASFRGSPFRRHAKARTAFYTAMYHAMIDPRCFADSDGAYPGGDVRRTPRKSDRYTRRTIFSGCDVYRSDFSLMTLIAPQVVCDTIDSLADLADESSKGYLERWEFLTAYSGCMNGTRRRRDRRRLCQGPPRF